ncbi:MAG TPA: hypothetical protein VKK31_16230 [Thermoanaerobaculia bacterium]|nr:hypothetical protein [Thermoanaerobaculia bacterium]
MRRSDGRRGLGLALVAIAVSCALGTGQPLRASPVRPALDPGVQTCLEHLKEADSEARLLCLGKLKAAGPAAEAAVPALCGILDQSDGATSHLLVASVLDVFRSLGPRAAPAAETLSSLLPHRHKLYKDRDKWLVIRLRAYIAVTLSEIGFPSSALPALLDTLAHTDERTVSMEIGAAVRAAGSLGPRGRELVPYLLDTLALRISEEEFSLERYEPQFPPNEATTVQLEAVRSLSRIASAEDREVLTALRQLADNQGQYELDPRVVRDARRAVELLQRKHGERQ